MRASLTVLVTILLAVVVLASTGCGLKGDLYLPEDETATAPPQAAEDGEDVEKSDSPGA
ncbi:LPS translocon maturation chaperone LptM [Wenzhouxiangella sp. EGI_FJ10305]|uniref:LPS translocon maturation chaperone LptM n=1 Tax=Wenzhouxiangella sp. EGI_FJ10305 TaxID=3243768 RepID=UPI0035E0AD9A